MGILATASDTFYSACATVAFTVTTLKEWFSYILHLNYAIVTTFYATLCDTFSVVVTVIDFIFRGLYIIFVYVFDFLAEIYHCISALFLLLWHIVVLLYKVLCLLLTGIEALFIGLWNGGLLAIEAVHQSAADVMETCESMSEYIAVLAHSLVTGVSSMFTTVGIVATTCVLAVWEGLAFIPATLSHLPRYFMGWLSGVWGGLTLWTTFKSCSLETFVGAGIIGILYIYITRYASMQRFRRLIFRSGLPRSQRTNRAEQIPLDREFESDADDDNDADSHTSGENHTDSDGEASEVHTELTLSDNDTDDEHSDVSLYSQSFSSGESDPEIEVQLPAEHERYSLRSRSSTPSRFVKNMTSDDFEREIERERDKRKCVVCQDANKSVLILPCRHMCLCIVCANAIVHSQQVDRHICPLCRTRIQKVIHVYV